MASWTKTKAIAKALFLEDEEEVLPRKSGDLAVVIAPILCSLNERREGTRIPDYFELIIPKYADDIFRSHFRFYKRSVVKICELVQNSTHLQQQQTGLIFFVHNYNTAEKT